MTLRFHYDFHDPFWRKFATYGIAVGTSHTGNPTNLQAESSGLPGLPPALALWIKVRLLPQADSTRPLSLTEAFTDVVWRRRVIDAAVVPDGEVINIFPPVTNLYVMVLDNETDKPIQEVLGLVLRETVDMLDMVAHGEHGLPASHRVGAHYRVDGLEDLTDILGGAARRGKQLEAVLVGCCVEVWLGVVCRERVEEAPECWRDPVIELVAGSPEGIWRILSAGAHISMCQGFP